MKSFLVKRENVVEAISTLDRFGVDERGRIVGWYEGYPPYVKLQDVFMALVKMPDDYIVEILFECDGMGCKAAIENGECPSPDLCHTTSDPFHAKNFISVVSGTDFIKFAEKTAIGDFGKEEK